MSGFGIFEEEEFTNRGAELFGTVERLDEMIEAVKWALCHDLSHFPVVPGTDGLRVAEVGGPPTVAYIYHTVDDANATLWRIEGI